MKIKFLKLTGPLLMSVLAAMSFATEASTLERIRASSTLTLGYLPDFAPFTAKEGDKASGYAISLCLQIAEKVQAHLGMTSLQIKFQPVSVADQFSTVSSGKVDILCTPTPATVAARQQVSFSIPIYTAGLSAVVRTDSSEALQKALNGEEAHSGPTWRATVNRGLSNQTYATVEGGVTEGWVRDQTRLLGVVATLVTAKDNDAGITLVAEGKADAFFSERMLLKNHVARDYPSGDLKIIERIFDYAPVSMAIQRGDEDFRLLVDTKLSELYRSGEIQRGYDQYLGGASDTARQLFKVYALPDAGL